MAIQRLQRGRIPLTIVLLIIWWTHMIRGQSPSRCQPRLNYSRSTLYTVEGAVLSFECNATYCGKNSSKPKLYWCRQTPSGCVTLLHLDEFANRTKMNLYFGSGTLTSLLRISPVLIKHSGKYQCRAQFPTFSQITVIGHLITVLVIKIEVFTPVTKVSGDEGGSLRLQCIVQSDTHLNTTLRVHWTKDNEKCNEPLSRDKSNNETLATGRQQFTLTLSDLQPDDAGLYYCCIMSRFSSQILGTGSVRVHVNAFNSDVLNFASLIICKGILLVIIVTFGLAYVCLLERCQQKSEDATVMSERKEVTKSSII